MPTGVVGPETIPFVVLQKPQPKLAAAELAEAEKKMEALHLDTRGVDAVRRDILVRDPKAGYVDDQVELGKIAGPINEKALDLNNKQSDPATEGFLLFLGGVAGAGVAEWRIVPKRKRKVFYRTPQI